MARATALVRHVVAVLRLLPLALILAAAGGCLAPTARQSLSVWIVSAGHQLAAGSSPLLENEVYSASGGSVRLTAAINETVAFQIGLRTTRPPAGPYNIQISDLSGPAGTLAARSAVSIYRAHYVRVEHFRSWYPEHAGRPATPTFFPDILVPWGAPRGGGPLKLEEARNELIWVDIRVPPTTEPGEYLGRVSLYGGSAGNPVFTSVIRLRVVPVALPGPRNLPLICRVDPRDLLSEHLRWPSAAAEETRLLADAPSHLAPVRLVRATMAMFHEHRATPVLWASFPKFRLAGDRAVEVEWGPYDELVGGWIDGDAFADRVGLALWPVPASLNYPNAERNGGLSSPRYARLLATYLAECRRHFAERGWLERSFVRLCPPAALTPDAVADVRRVGGIIRQSESGLPLVAHLPARSLRGLGWRNATPIELPAVDIWAPRAMWYEPEAMQRERGLGRRTWLLPDHPPYSGSLAVEAPPADARVLAWQAYRYDAQAIWVEHAAEFAVSESARSSGRPRPRETLIYPGKPYGLLDRPVPSIRLKRLRQGLQDFELLRLLERRGKRLLARRIAEQVVRWACTDACVDNLLTCRSAGWPDDGRAIAMARGLLLQELVNEFNPEEAGAAWQIAELASWGRLMNQAERVRPELRGVRLASDADHLRLRASVGLSNPTDRTLRGRWQLVTPPVGWRQPDPLMTTLPANAQKTATVELVLSGLAYNTDGIYSFELRFDTDAMGAFAVPARLAVAACPYVEKPPTLDGDLSDWIMPLNNAAGDFLLCHGRRAGLPPERVRTPTLRTQAFFCMDDEHLYVAVRCTLKEGEPPLWQADNTVPIDGAVPWGQDVVEILIDPRGSAAPGPRAGRNLPGTTSDPYILQIKPNGVLLAHKGCRTDPPMGAYEPWQCGARAKVRVRPEAWVVELSLPLTALGPDALRNRIWGFNVTRLDARRGEYSSWSGTRGHRYTPRSMGNLVLLRP